MQPLSPPPPISQVTREWSRVWLTPVESFGGDILHRRPPFAAMMRRALFETPIATGSLVTVPASDGTSCVCRCHCEGTSSPSATVLEWGFVVAKTGIHVEVEPLPASGAIAASRTQPRVQIPVKSSAVELSALLCGLLAGEIPTTTSGLDLGKLPGRTHTKRSQTEDPEPAPGRQIGSVLCQGPEGVGKRHTVQYAAEVTGSRLIRLSTRGMAKDATEV